VKPDRVELSEKEKKARASRNLAIGLALAAFAVLLYVATWAKLGANVLNRPL
jgi:hypothetical protein